MNYEKGIASEILSLCTTVINEEDCKTVEEFLNNMENNLDENEEEDKEYIEVIKQIRIDINNFRAIVMQHKEEFDMEYKRAILMEYLQTIFRGNANAMLQMFRKHTGYTGNNDFINNCNEQEADIFIRKYNRSFENCRAIWK